MKFRRPPSFISNAESPSQPFPKGHRVSTKDEVTADHQRACDRFGRLASKHVTVTKGSLRSCPKQKEMTTVDTFFWKKKRISGGYGKQKGAAGGKAVGGGGREFRD